MGEAALREVEDPMLVGIDVAKAELVVGTRSTAERWTVENDERGVRTLVERLRLMARR